MEGLATAYLVFISHSSTDAWTAKQLEKAINALGAHTFLSATAVAGGDEVGNALKDAMHHADECVVLYTPEAVKSLNVMGEISVFWRDEKRVVMLVNRQTIQDVTSNPKFPPYLKSLHFLDLNGETDSKYLPELKARIQAAGRKAKN